MHRRTQWIASAVGGQLHGTDVAVTAPVVTDSREAETGSLYVARRGENADGHDYLARAVAAGAVAALVERVVPEVDVPQILVEDATWALGELARVHLRELREAGDLKVLAVTGSAGKTTTKDLLRQLLAPTEPTVAPKLSFNNEVGLPLTILRADCDTRFLVLEMGASGPGHIDYLTRIAAPDLAIELMVGHAHMGGFGSIDGVADAKAELVRGLVPGGTAVLNADDPRVAAMASQCPGPVLRFSAQGDEGAHVRARAVVTDACGRPVFLLEGVLPGSDSFSEPVTARLVGAHHVNNMLAATTAALALGLDPAEVAARLSAALPESPHRMDVRDLRVSGARLTLIDDSYNANLDSMGAAVRALGALGAGRPKVAVLGEMLELGDASADIHRQVGAMVAGVGPDLVIALGEEAREYLTVLPTDLPTHHVLDAETATQTLLAHLPQDAVVLVKGSLYSHVHRVADLLVEKGEAR
ncbi:UDP-N-acetylmuramoyl-tripeptide--D-alanyl-D-alanine ligase [Schaalia sp. 19OD2882]|uniref:UDP-N-acetylmuramoyl-tripeptide--D-alanyl-D- alanine ligase n=1 Tax=Schaalia sp. 19OD2882 TaxID=2794089 RepID=UPI001C1EAC95|nr:UDP-N-acetylmuramoyl-tripeptide--D-alanyl-D-alanine ligase [Schaalia sp. 19OD2882]QWW18944.1 UDP-N-acetylmuramoyl-tripeptide--D-alanyl-D-alanine ligase [Schaalia sp. 19OD2882]